MTKCKGCWWEEGGRCYNGEPERISNGSSTVMAEERCEKFLGKRAFLSNLIPNEKLVITSEFIKGID